MPLSLLVVLVIGGIGGVTILLHMLGLSEVRKLTDESDIRMAWLREFPDHQIRAVLANSGGNAALVQTAVGPGLVWVVGLDTVARPLGQSDVSELDRGLCFWFRDPGAPKVTVRLDPDEKHLWKAALAEKS